jgi:hypothetical protein
MNKFRWMHGMTLGVLAFALMLSLPAVSSVQARPNYPSDGSEPVSPDPVTRAKTQVYDPQAFQSSWGVSPDTLISCDPNGNLLTQLKPGNMRSSHSLQNAACLQQAALDAQAAKTPALKYGTASNCSGCSKTGVSGDGKDIKVYSVFTETRYVYLQCGKKVAEFGPPSCGCSGNYRYTYSCQKPPTVYINLPCHH